MSKLISRNKFTPAGGFLFRQPEVNWEAPRNASFDQVVQGLIAARNGNPFKRDKFHWATDYNSVAEEVDQFNARICEANGWTDYITGGGGSAIPFPELQQPALQKLKSVAADVRRIAEGAKVLLDWESSGDPPVPAELSAKRAATCATCPKNDVKPLTDWFTVPAAELIKKRMARIHELKLTTPDDEKLGTCLGCLCPLPLAVHCPIEYKLKHLPDEVRKDLDARCWVLAEEKSLIK
jgi:hypothetical protein